MASSESVYDHHADWYAGIVRQRKLIHLQIMPQIIDLIGGVAGQHVLDVACGEGVFSRELAAHGAHVTGVDLSRRLLAIAESTPGVPKPVYIHDDARMLSKFRDQTFHGATCIMAMMDIDDIEAVFASVGRVSTHDAWFVVVITHPCFESPRASSVEIDGKLARVTTQYLTEGYWRGTESGVRSRFGAQHRTISTYLNAAIDSGWSVEHMAEPHLVNVGDDGVADGGDHPGLLLLRLRRRP